MSSEGAHIEGENIDPAGSSKAKLSDWQQQGLQFQFSKSLEHLTQRDRLNTTPQAAQEACGQAFRANKHCGRLYVQRMC